MGGKGWKGKGRKSRREGERRDNNSYLHAIHMKLIGHTYFHQDVTRTAVLLIDP